MVAIIKLSNQDGDAFFLNVMHFKISSTSSQEMTTRCRQYKVVLVIDVT